MQHRFFSTVSQSGGRFVTLNAEALQQNEVDNATAVGKVIANLRRESMRGMLRAFVVCVFCFVFLNLFIRDCIAFTITFSQTRAHDHIV
jgi:hypothetical protein